MKKVIHFSKAYIPCVILSCAIIALGIVSVFTRGINFGIDFKPGLIQEVRIVPPAISLTYEGASSVSVETASSGKKPHSEKSFSLRLFFLPGQAFCSEAACPTAGYPAAKILLKSWTTLRGALCSLR